MVHKGWYSYDFDNKVIRMEVIVDNQSESVILSWYMVTNCFKSATNRCSLSLYGTFFAQGIFDIDSSRLDSTLIIGNKTSITAAIGGNKFFVCLAVSRY